MNTDTHTETVNTIRAVSFLQLAFTNPDGTQIFEKKRYQMGFYYKDILIDEEKTTIVITVIEVEPISAGWMKLRIYVSIGDKNNKPINGRVALWLEIDAEGVEIEHNLSLLKSIGGK